jgi:hypothetical protein
MKPISYLIMNATNLGSSTLLTFDQVKTLFSEVIFSLVIFFIIISKFISKVWKSNSNSFNSN